METPLPAQQPQQNLGVRETKLPAATPQRSSFHFILFITSIVLLVTAIVYLGYQNWQLKQQVSRIDKIIQVDNTFSKLSSLPPPTPTPDPTTNWKTYSFQGGFFKYPSRWSENPVLTRGSGFTQEIKDMEGLYSLTFSTQGNYSQLTGKSYVSPEEFIGMPSDTVMVDGQEGKQMSPRAGSENKNAVVFFSKDKKGIYTLELDTGNSSLADPRVTEENLKTGQKLFDQILSTFKLLNQTTNATNWKTYQSQVTLFQYPADWSLDSNGKRITATNPKVDLWVYGNDEPMMNECMQIVDTRTTDYLMIKKYTSVITGEACSGGDMTKKEIWITKAGGSGFQPGIIYAYSSAQAKEAEEVFSQILSTFKFLETSNFPTVKPVSLLPIFSWQTVSNDKISLKYPTDIYSVEIHDKSIQLIAKSDPNNRPDFLVESYDGGSRRIWYNNYFSYYPNEVKFIDKQLGSVSALYGLYSQPPSSNENYLVSSGKTIVLVIPQGADTKILETIISTITFTN